MKPIRSFVLHFYVPLLLSIFLVLLIIVSPKFITSDSKVQIDAQVSVLGITIPLPVWLEKVWLLRALLITASLLSLTKALTVDFSKYFPTSLNMDVYFDEKGIERNLRIFSAEEQSEVSIATNWKQHVSVYDETVVASIGQLWRQRRLRDMPDITDFSRDLVHARGSTTFVVKRVGLFCYRIEESSGRLDYDWDIPKKPRRTFCSLFTLRETASNHLRPKIKQLFQERCLVLAPEFKQIFSTEIGAQNAPFDHTVIGFTKVFLFPFPRFSNTLYLWKLSNGMTVPIAYAVYIHEAMI